MDDIDLFEDMRERIRNSDTMESLAVCLIEYHHAKDERYKQSWAKRGLVGYWSGALGRSTDRIDENFARLLDENYTELDVVHVLDTLTDVGLYAFMGIRMIQAYWPAIYEKFIAKLREEIEDGNGLSDVRMGDSQGCDG